MRIVKKFIILLFCILPTTLFGCNALKDKPENHISQIRSDIFFGEKDNLSAFVYAERREIPFISDGLSGEVKNCLVVRLPSAEQKLPCTLSYQDKSYSLTLLYDPATACLTSTVQVEKLPKNNVTLSVNGTDILLSSVLKADSISVNSALKRVLKAEKSFVNSLYKKDKFNAEIYIRLLFEGDFNYYYVGFAQSDKITAFLVDAKSGEIIAGRTSS